MISPVSNQYYFNPYASLPATQPAGTPTARPQSDSAPVAGTPDTQRSQEVKPKECKTCRARRYKDQSTDASVSFQTPTYVSPETAASTVAAHEQEHVQHNAQKAQREGMKATSFVQINTAICPECGRSYVSGGKTTTYYSPKQPAPGEDGNGRTVDIRV